MGMRSAFSVTAALVMAATACRFPDLPELGPNDGGVDAGASCAPRCTDSNVLITCDGDMEIRSTCPAGCEVESTPHCRQLVPSNGASYGDLDAVAADLVVAAGEVVILNTGDGRITRAPRATPDMFTLVRGAGAGLESGIRFRTIAQAQGVPEIGMFAFRSLTIEAGEGSTPPGLLIGEGPRAVLLLLATEANIRGQIDVGAKASGTGCDFCAGPGGGAGGTSGDGDGFGCAPGRVGYFNPQGDETGGGGGGLGTLAARGGSSPQSPGGNITPLGACPGDDLVPLLGGSGGGAGAVNEMQPTVQARGGSGGGAIQISAMARISVSGADIYAGGGGGEGIDFDLGGGGGGAGGGVLLEAPAVDIVSSSITANGGGGGSGRTPANGQHGLRTASRASGGAGTGTAMDTGRGGLGAIGLSSGQEATAGNGDYNGTGGGGGGAGLIRINSASPPSINTATLISPAHTAGPVELR